MNMLDTNSFASNSQLECDALLSLQSVFSMTLNPIHFRWIETGSKPYPRYITDILLILFWTWDKQKL